MKRIRVATADADDCFRVERTLNEAGIPFKLIVQMDNHLLLDVEDESVRKALELLERAGFKADIVPA